MDLSNVAPEPRRAAPAVLDRQQTLKLVHTIFQLRAAGDIDGILPYLHDDIVCFPPTSWSFASFPYTLRGKAAVRQALLHRHINYIFLPSVVHRLLIDGDSAIVHRTSFLMPRGGGAMQPSHVVDLVRFRDGLVAEFIEFPDGAARERLSKFPH